MTGKYDRNRIGYRSERWRRYVIEDEGRSEDQISGNRGVTTTVTSTLGHASSKRRNRLCHDTLFGAADMALADGHTPRDSRNCSIRSRGTVKLLPMLACQMGKKAALMMKKISDGVDDCALV
nr:hypothetical protein CFP56_54488 [Quercus suber]